MTKSILMDKYSVYSLELNKSEITQKSVAELIEYFEEKDFSVYLREVKYGLGEDDYMYEIHIL